MPTQILNISLAATLLWFLISLGPF